MLIVHTQESNKGGGGEKNSFKRTKKHSSVDLVYVCLFTTGS